MRVEKFDDELIAALRVLGFKVADDKESAEIDTEVSIMRPEGSKEFWLQVQFPNDVRHALRFNISRAEIMELVNDDDEEDDDAA